MYLEHKLATKTNHIPLRFDPESIETIHEEDAEGNVKHIGWAINASYAGDNPRSRAHTYRWVFTPEEADELFNAWAEMRERFEPGWTPPDLG